MHHIKLGDSADMAALGGRPAFARPLPFGQLYFPTWEEYENNFHALFQRQYYTNQGPLAERLEAELAGRLQVRNVVCVTNETIGLSVAAEALGIKGRVVVPAFVSIATAQSLLWSNLTPLFCDIDPATHTFNFDHLEHLLEIGADAILAVNLWGGTGEVARLESLAKQYGIPLYFDSAHGLGGVLSDGRPMGGCGNAEVFSFHAAMVMSAGEGGGIATNDDELAERMRNIRSSYGIRRPLAVDRTANGRMSEAQAAIGLLSLAALDSRIERNRQLHDGYCQRLADIPGITVHAPANVQRSNCQHLVCEIDAEQFGLARDTLLQALWLENITAQRYFSPGAHRGQPFASSFPHSVKSLPETDNLCSRVLQLPLGAGVDPAAVSLICNKIKLIQQVAEKVGTAMERDA